MERNSSTIRLEECPFKQDGVSKLFLFGQQSNNRHNGFPNLPGAVRLRLRLLISTVRALRNL
jgi:hypothetical protein